MNAEQYLDLLQRIQNLLIDIANRAKELGDNFSSESVKALERHLRNVLTTLEVLKGSKVFSGIEGEISKLQELLQKALSADNAKEFLQSLGAGLSSLEQIIQNIEKGLYRVTQEAERAGKKVQEAASSNWVNMGDQYKVDKEEGREVFRLYTARILLEEGKVPEWLLRLPKLYDQFLSRLNKLGDEQAAERFKKALGLKDLEDAYEILDLLERKIDQVLSSLAEASLSDNFRSDLNSLEEFYELLLRVDRILRGKFRSPETASGEEVLSKSNLIQLLESLNVGKTFLRARGFISAEASVERFLNNLRVLSQVLQSVPWEEFRKRAEESGGRPIQELTNQFVRLMATIQNADLSDSDSLLAFQQEIKQLERMIIELLAAYENLDRVELKKKYPTLSIGFSDVKVTKNLEDLKRQFPGIEEAIKRLGIEFDRLSGRAKVSIADVEKNIQKIQLEEGITIYFRADTKEFDTSLKRLKEKLSAKELQEVSKQFREAILRAAEYGYSLENLKKVEEISGGVARLTFEMRTNSGVTRRLIVYQDELGNVLIDNQKRFLSFTDAIIRNTFEALRWAFAVSVVYGGLRKLEEAIDQTIEVESKLASIAVVLGKGRESFQQVFESAYEISRQFGVGIDEVLEGYTTAYRIAGGEAKNTAEQIKLTNQLLKDALVLSKLTGEELSSTIDAYVAVLRQFNIPIEEGIKSIDKFVFLSQHAQTTVVDLTEAMAQSAASAESVGLSFDQLAAYIAALSEVSTYTGEEIGTILRSLFSNIQSDRAREELRLYGIVVEDVSGELRNFDDILRDIHEKFKAGIISEGDLAKIGRAIGGGARRGPQFVQLIKAYDQIIRYSDLLTNTNIELGSSYDAIDVKTTTVQSELARLSNAFVKLAGILGEQGGLLNLLHNFTSAIVWMTDSLGDVIGVLGEQGLIGVFGGIGIALNKSSYAFRQFESGLSKAVRAIYKLKYAEDEAAKATLEFMNKFSRGIYSNLLGFGVTAMATMTASSFEQGLTTALGGVIGTFFGGPVGATIGAALGSMIGEGINTALAEVEPDIQEKLKRIFAEGVKSGVEEGMRNAEVEKGKVEQKQLLGDILDTDTLVKGSIMTLGARLWSTIFGDALGWIAEKTGLGTKEEVQAAKSYAEKVTKGFGSLNWKEEIIYAILEDLRAGIPEGVIMETYGITEEQLQKLQEYLNLLDQAAAADLSQPFDEASFYASKYYQSVIKTSQAYQYGERVIQKYRKETEDLFNAGEITYKEYRERLEKLARMHAAITPLVTELSGEFGKFGSEIQSTTDLYDALANIFINGTKEEIDLIQQLAQEIRVLKREGKPTDEAVKEFEKAVRGVEANIARRTLKLPEYKPVDMTMDEVELWLQEIARLQEEYIRKAVENGLVPSEDAIRSYFAGIDPIFVYTKDGIMKAVGEGLDISRFGAQARKNLEELGLLGGDQTFDVRILDIESKDRGRLYAALERAARTLQTLAPYYKLDPKPLGVVFKDNVTDILHVDMLQLQLALRELVDLNRKQLDGLYNLPEDMTFFVPWAAWEMAANAAFSEPKFVGEKPEPPKKPEMKMPDFSIIDEVLNKIAEIEAELRKPFRMFQTRELLPPEPQKEPYARLVAEGMDNLVAEVTKFTHGPVANLGQELRNAAEYAMEKYLTEKGDMTPTRKEAQYSAPDEYGFDIDKYTKPQEEEKGFFEKTWEWITNALGQLDFPTSGEIVSAIKNVEWKADLGVQLNQEVVVKIDSQEIAKLISQQFYRDLLTKSKSFTVTRITTTM